MLKLSFFKLIEIVLLNVFQCQPFAERNRDRQRVLPAAAVLPFRRLHHQIECQVN